MGITPEQLEGMLRVGMSVLVQFDPDRKGLRCPAVVRGWQSGQYLILDMRLQVKRSVVFTPSRDCSVSFIHEGLACIFSAILIDWEIERSNGHIRLQWPKELRSATLRKSQRVTLEHACRVTLPDGNAIDGHIHDVSEGGCGLTLKVTPGVGQFVTLTTRLPDGHMLQDVLACVRNVRQDGSACFVGLEFAESNVDAKEAIRFYIQSSLVRMRSAESHAARIVLLDNPAQPLLGGLGEALIKDGFDAVLTYSVVDAFFQTRLKVPEVLLISTEMGHVSASTVALLLHEATGLGELPVLFYGLDPDVLQEQVSAVPGAGCIKDIHNLDEVFQAISKHVAR